MVSPHSELVLTTSLWSIMQPQFCLFLTSNAELSLRSSKNVWNCLCNIPTVLNCDYIAGFDGFNNDNLDVGGTQFAEDFDNNANQINFKTPGSTTSQFNGEL